MRRQSKRLIAHHEGNGRLLGGGGTTFSVRYFLDTWIERIATGTGLSAEMRCSDGFVWWNSADLPHTDGILETEDGQRIRINLIEFNANRAHFYCIH
jgi:hypothetical protein